MPAEKKGNSGDTVLPGKGHVPRSDGGPPEEPVRVGQGTQDAGPKAPPREVSCSSGTGRVQANRTGQRALKHSKAHPGQDRSSGDADDARQNRMRQATAQSGSEESYGKGFRHGMAQGDQGPGAETFFQGAL